MFNGASAFITSGSILTEVKLLVYWGLTPQQQPGSYQGGEMMMTKSVFWWRKPEYPEETTDLRQVTDETFHTYVNSRPGGIMVLCMGKVGQTFPCYYIDNVRPYASYSPANNYTLSRVVNPGCVIVLYYCLTYF